MIIMKKVKIFVVVREVWIKILNVWYFFVFKCMFFKIFGFWLNICREYKKYYLYIENLLFFYLIDI